MTIIYSYQYVHILHKVHFLQKFLELIRASRCKTDIKVHRKEKYMIVPKAKYSFDARVHICFIVHNRNKNVQEGSFR